MVEVSSRRAVGRVVLEAPAAARHGFAAATLQVVGAAEGAPVEVVAARAPVAAVRMTVRFADGRETTVPVHGGFAVALERRGGAVPVGAVVTATARGGAELARRSLQPGRPWVAGCGGR